MIGNLARWSIARFPIEGFFVLVVSLWIVFSLVVMGIAFGIHNFGTVSGSIWEHASQLPRWFAFAIGAWLMFTYMPVYIAHGLTRREFAVKTSLFLVALATILTILVTVGFWLERLLYRANDWSQELSTEHLFTSATDLPLIGMAFFLVFLIWTVTGCLVGAGFYRLESGGWLMVLIGVLLVGVADLAVNTTVPFFGFIFRLTDEILLDPGQTSLITTVALCTGSFLLGIGSTWALVRDVPLRNEAV